MAKKKSPHETARKRKEFDQSAEMVAHAELPTRYGRFTIHGFRGARPQDEAVALVRGNIRGPFKFEEIRCHWCAFIRNALPAMCSPRCAAIAARNSNFR